MLLSVRERILTIKVLDKISRQPMYAAMLGIECVQKKKGEK